MAPSTWKSRSERISSKKATNRSVLRLTHREDALIDIDVEHSDSYDGRPFSVPIHPSIEPRRTPALLDLDDIRARKGALALYLDDGLAKEMFPCLSHEFQPFEMACLLSLTRLVGMECPGLRSIFSSFRISFTASDFKDALLNYQVTLADERVSMVKITLSNQGVSGEIQAFCRPRPCAQPSFDEVASRVQRDEFFGTRAIVLGGSRGIGEVTAKILSGRWRAFRSYRITEGKTMRFGFGMKSYPQAGSVRFFCAM